MLLRLFFFFLPFLFPLFFPPPTTTTIGWISGSLRHNQKKSKRRFPFPIYSTLSVIKMKPGKPYRLSMIIVVIKIAAKEPRSCFASPPLLPAWPCVTEASGMSWVWIVICFWQGYFMWSHGKRGDVSTLLSSHNVNRYFTRLSGRGVDVGRDCRRAVASGSDL